MPLEPPPLIDAPDLTVSAADQAMQASADIREYCGWHIAPVITSTVRMTTRGGRVLILPTLKLISVTSAAKADGTPIDLTGAGLADEGLVELASGCWPVGIGAVTIVFVHGHEDVPEGIRSAAAAIASRKPAQRLGIVQEAGGGVSRQYGGDLAGGFGARSGFTYAEQATLDRYRIAASP